jgi:predicted Fe-S protein YdhL (DUF1289 family)
MKTVPSPCVTGCEWDSEKNCTKCLRTNIEIKKWKSCSNNEKLDIWERILKAGYKYSDRFNFGVFPHRE